MYILQINLLYSHVLYWIWACVDTMLVMHKVIWCPICLAIPKQGTVTNTQAKTIVCVLHVCVYVKTISPELHGIWGHVVLRVLQGCLTCTCHTHTRVFSRGFEGGILPPPPENGLAPPEL